MPARRNNRRYLLWLALGTTFMAAAMAVLLALQVTQQRSIRKSSDLRSDSITALAFQLEREFLRLRQALELHAQSEVPNRPLKKSPADAGLGQYDLKRSANNPDEDDERQPRLPGGDVQLHQP